MVKALKENQKRERELFYGKFQESKLSEMIVTSKVGENSEGGRKPKGHRLF
jgi:hypothetical protein